MFHRSIQSCGDQSANSLASLSISCLRVPLIVTSSSWNERPSGSMRGRYSFHSASPSSLVSIGHIGIITYVASGKVQSEGCEGGGGEGYEAAAQVAARVVASAEKVVAVTAGGKGGAGQGTRQDEE